MQPLHRYGWIPDLPDERDLPYATLAIAVPPLPRATNLMKYCSPIEDQGNLGSCTAQALVGNLEFLKKKLLGKTINFSRLFVYYNERLALGTVASDSGASLRTGIKTLVKQGDCAEKIWPYHVEAFAVKPPIIAYQKALDHQIARYYRLNTLVEMKHTLAMGYPFVFGFTVYESMETSMVNETGTIPLPKLTERVRGGHAIMAVGYNDEEHVFLIRNSWGYIVG